MARSEPWTDEELLQALHLRDNEGMSFQQIADRMGRSRSSAIGALNRVDKATDKHDTTPHLNGTMPAKWWKR